MRPVDCRACGLRVLAEKKSPPHTSVQWPTGSATACAEFAPQVAAGRPPALVPHCTALRESVDRAVRDGMLEVPADD